MSLDIRIKCNLPEAQQFVILVNPKDNIASGKLFHDLYPTAWKVARFSPIDRTPNGNQVVALNFSRKRTAGVATVTSGNEVIAGWTSPVGEGKNNWFKTQNNEGAIKLVLNDTPDTKISAEVSNMEPKPVNIFFGDESGDPFMYQTVSAGNTVEFVEKTKIVIVAVKGYKENDVIKSDIKGSWLEFQVEDTLARGNQFYVEYDFNNQYNLYSGNNVPFQQFASNIPVFQPSSLAKPASTVDNVRGLEVEA
ncbi:hypothetical protein BGZ72_000025 [Mortierella alpina]|nr:hypothetical protein BGZ72_000025 [Mortierella alpina]